MVHDKPKTLLEIASGHPSPHGIALLRALERYDVAGAIAALDSIIKEEEAEIASERKGTPMNEARDGLNGAWRSALADEAKKRDEALERFRLSEEAKTKKREMAWKIWSAFVLLLILAEAYLVMSWQH